MLWHVDEIQRETYLHQSVLRPSPVGWGNVGGGGWWEGGLVGGG